MANHLDAKLDINTYMHLIKLCSVSSLQLPTFCQALPHSRNPPMHQLQVATFTIESNELFKGTFQQLYHLLRPTTYCWTFNTACINKCQIIYLLLKVWLYNSSTYFIQLHRWKLVTIQLNWMEFIKMSIHLYLPIILQRRNINRRPSLLHTVECKPLSVKPDPRFDGVELSEAVPWYPGV